MIYFTSDLHFFHEKIIKHRNRPFASADKMNDKLIKNWNDTVTFNDEVYILGDFTMKGGAAANSILNSLNGKKYIIKGNHDNFIDEEVFNLCNVVWVKDYYELEYEKSYKFVLFHYPIYEWHWQRKGSIHLHGHIHSDGRYNGDMQRQGILRYDVGVDANDFKPVSIKDIIKKLI